MRDLARRLGREAIAIARQGSLIARAPRAPHGRVEGERVVVFLHGFMAAGPVFGPMRRHVEARAPVGTVDLTYGPLDRFEPIADRLARAIDRVAEGRRVDLVGHSLGGIVMRWYLQELGGAARVDRIVTVASPHAGTRSADIGIVPLARAIRPGSRVIETLRAGRAKASSVAHTAIVAGADRMITPPTSAASLEDATIHWIDDLGHNEALFDPRVFEHVAGALRG
jgi:pimeloyl-ACP methyl ester carboxylesterase